MLKGRIAVLAVVVLTTCAAPDKQGGEDWKWVLVATLDNPGHSPAAERALEQIAGAFLREDVHWSAGVSAGYSLSIDSRCMPRGLEILRDVIQRLDLPVQIIEE